MFLKKLGKRGVAMTEYAILLAFVAAVGASFTSDNGLASSIKDAVGKAENAINLAMGKSQNKLAVKDNAKKYEDVLNRLFDAVIAATPEGADPSCIKVKDNGDGTAKVQYTYNNVTGYNQYPVVDGVDISFLKDKGYSLSGDNFFYFNSDDSIGLGGNSAPTRIMINDPETGKTAYLRYDAEEKAFYDNGGYFADP
ncbi:MAG: hypothetical protein ACI3XH_02030 [Phascolarctobacterium sp.]